MAAINLPTEQGPVIQDDKPNGRPWLWACGGCTVLVCVVLGVIAFVLFSSSNESYPLEGKVSFPSFAKKGDNFDLVLTLTNPGAESVFIKHFTLQNYVGLPSLLDAVQVVSVEPSMESEPLFEKEVQFPYFQEIKPGETLTVIFHMLAEKTGTYYIDVGVYGRDPVLADPAFITAFWFGPGKVEITP
jgi:hypothetical protein